MSTHQEIYHPNKTHCVLEEEAGAQTKVHAKTGLSSSEQIRITLIYVAIISFLSLWNIRMNTINHEVNSLQSNCLNKADQPVGDRC